MGGLKVFNLGNNAAISKNSISFKYILFDADCSGM